MSVIVNPGSGGIPPEGAGWTNTYVQARANAQEWLDKKMHSKGMTDVELLSEADEINGRWRFTFRHKVTGTCAWLEIDGIDNMDAYEKQAWFPPKIYWNGGSVGEPELEDFAADGFVALRTFKRA